MILRGDMYKQWLNDGGDSRTGIIATHVVLCYGCSFPKNKSDQASHLCHNPQCVHPQHIAWEALDLHGSRDMCRRHGSCLGHERWNARPCVQSSIWSNQSLSNDPSEGFKAAVSSAW